MNVLIIDDDAAIIGSISACLRKKKLFKVDELMDRIQA